VESGQTLLDKNNLIASETFVSRLCFQVTPQADNLNTRLAFRMGPLWPMRALAHSGPIGRRSRRLGVEARLEQCHSTPSAPRCAQAAADAITGGALLSIR
jgi:hypothetical protein